MSDPLSQFVAALGLSIAYCAPPGAVTAEALRRGCEAGFRAALRFQLGAVAGSSLGAALALGGLLALVASRPVHIALGLAGALLVLRLAWRAFDDAWAARLPQPSGRVTGRDFSAGCILGLANPFALAFWLGAGAGLMPAGSTAPHEAQAVLLAGFVVGSLLYRGAFTAVMATGHRFLTVAGVRWLHGGCGVALGYFGLRLLARTVALL